MPFVIRQLSWHKRRRAEKTPQPIQVEVFDFKQEANHTCRVHVKFDNGESYELKGRVTQNPVNHAWFVSAMNATGQAVSLKYEPE